MILWYIPYITRQGNQSNEVRWKNTHTNANNPIFGTDQVGKAPSTKGTVVPIVKLRQSFKLLSILLGRGVSAVSLVALFQVAELL